jgi:hypothetical protein
MSTYGEFLRSKVWKAREDFEKRTKLADVLGVVKNALEAAAEKGEPRVSFEFQAII